MLCRNHVTASTLSGAPLLLCPHRLASPTFAIVTYYRMSDYPNCALSPTGGLVAQEGGFMGKKRFYRAENIKSRFYLVKTMERWLPASGPLRGTAGQDGYR